MKYSEDAYHLKMTPENDEDRAYLREKFPHLQGESVCVAALYCPLCGEGYLPAMGIHKCETLRQHHHLTQMWRQ